MNLIGWHLAVNGRFCTYCSIRKSVEGEMQLKPALPLMKKVTNCLIADNHRVSHGRTNLSKEILRQIYLFQRITAVYTTGSMTWLKIRGYEVEMKNKTRLNLFVPILISIQLTSSLNYTYLYT